MKVTKLIREYVEGRVHLIFADAIDTADKAVIAEKETTKKHFATIREQLETEAVRLAEESNQALMQFAERLGTRITAGIYREENHFFSFSYYSQNSKKVEALQARVTALRDQEKQAVNDILVSLELGATKSDLEMLLVRVKVD